MKKILAGCALVLGLCSFCSADSLTLELTQFANRAEEKHIVGSARYDIDLTPSLVASVGGRMALDAGSWKENRFTCELRQNFGRFYLSGLFENKFENRHDQRVWLTVGTKVRL